MTRLRSPHLLIAAAIVSIIPACSAGRKEQEVAEEFRQDSLSVLRAELADQAMQASMFVNEVNKALAKARSLSQTQTQLLTTSELADVNAERNATLGRVTQLVEQLDAARGRITGLRKQVADKDTALANELQQFEATLADANASAAREKTALQAVIDSQTVRIASLTGRVDTLSGSVARLTSDQNTVYVIAGSREDLMKKGILVSEGPRRFGFVGRRAVVPARSLDPDSFTRLDRRSDTTIVLPDGVYKMLSRQNGAVAVPKQWKHGGIVGALTIEDPEQFWNTSKFLILVKS
ncbi:MAG TPA: hypothetical protein VJ867_00050 [Gemmatimonadaceae bacterium]|nr:hypothetical protein [Gemmatimonadaceae bacterium]